MVTLLYINLAFKMSPKKRGISLLDVALVGLVFCVLSVFGIQAVQSVCVTRFAGSGISQIFSSY